MTYIICCIHLASLAF